MEEISIIFTKRWNCINILGPTTIILWMTILSNEYVYFDERGNCLSIVDKCVDCYVINFAYLTFERFSWIIDDYNSLDQHIEIFTWTEFNRMLKKQITEVSRLTVTLKLMTIEHSSTQRHCKTTINKQQHKTFPLNFSKNHFINSQRYHFPTFNNLPRKKRSYVFYIHFIYFTCYDTVSSDFH